MEKIKFEVLQLAEAHGLTKVQLFALHSIEQNGEVPMGQMADVMHCDASNVTGIVDRMVSQGLIVRQECPQDRRAKRLHLTPKGKEVIDAIMASLPAHLGCDRLNSAERESLHHALVKLCS